eukprot:2693683-Prymnesium_polylepis.2
MARLRGRTAIGGLCASSYIGSRSTPQRPLGPSGLTIFPDLQLSCVCPIRPTTFTCASGSPGDQR